MANNHITRFFNQNKIFMKKLIPILMLSLITVSAVVISCSKNDNETTNLRVRLTDNPIDLDSVFVDVKEVRVKMGDDGEESLNDEGWVTLATNAGIYDLLRLQNGVDTLLAVGPVPSGFVREIRLILGDRNRVVDTLGVSHNLRIPSGSESGLKIKVKRKLNATLETLLIDFDAALSIKKENDGYKLRPVIKLM